MMGQMMAAALQKSVGILGSVEVTTKGDMNAAGLSRTFAIDSVETIKNE